MLQYSARDVERLVHIPRSRIRSLVDAGFVSPERGPRNAWRFSFQDLIVLRTAHALSEAHVPNQRITRSVKALRRRLPDSMPLSSLNLAAEGNRVVVKEGARRWQAESGQYLLGFESESAEGSLSIPASSSTRRCNLEQQCAEPTTSATDWFDRGVALETQDPAAAIEAYERAIAVDPGLLKARINLGCLLHETGRLDRAESVYRDALRVSGDDPVVLYDLAVLLDDRGRKHEAMEAYRAALRVDPRFVDCHFNLALLCEHLGKPKDAIQHMAAYRRLTSTTRPR